MSDVADYDADILLWSERQAALLRELKARARDLPNQLDLENVAEEIESVGRSELAAVKSHLRNILRRLAKAASKPDTDLALHWMSEIRTFRADLADRITPSMRQNIDLQKLWAQAKKDAAADLGSYGEAPPPLPDACPLELGELASEEFEPQTALALFVRAPE